MYEKVATALNVLGSTLFLTFLLVIMQSPVLFRENEIEKVFSEAMKKGKSLVE